MKLNLGAFDPDHKFLSQLIWKLILNSLQQTPKEFEIYNLE